MNTAFDPLNLLLLAIAVVVFLKLRSVLGTRTGHEKTIEFPPLGGAETQRESKPASTGSEEEDDVPRGLPEEEPPVWEGVAEEGSPLARVLEGIREKDPSFTVPRFLDGARAAYEMIITAFAAGDEQTLKPLLARDVFEGFRRAIEERRRQGQTLELEFVGIDDARIIDGSLKGNIARLTVKFVSEVITALKDREGRVIEGDPGAVTKVTDIWTFERDVTSADPNWTLVATEVAEEENKAAGGSEG
jgi:predicted lipid-binding transport protein (Tim44 family)